MKIVGRKKVASCLKQLNITLTKWVWWGFFCCESHFVQVFLAWIVLPSDYEWKFLVRGADVQNAYSCSWSLPWTDNSEKSCYEAFLHTSRGKFVISWPFGFNLLASVNLVAFLLLVRAMGHSTAALWKHFIVTAVSTLKSWLQSQFSDWALGLSMWLCIEQRE